MSLPGTLWHLVATLLAPVAPLYLRMRQRSGRDLPARRRERYGETAQRPPGTLLWIHAASIGETLSVLPVLPPLLAARPRLSILLTTGTVTAATLLAERLEPDLAARVVHRFVPLDVPAWAARFLDGWRPDAAAFVESELWPNLLAAARKRGIPLALLNARLSPRSARRWAWAPGFARDILGGFALVQGQSAADAERLLALGARTVTAPGNLKFAAPPLPAAPDALAALRAATAGRPILLAASTHPGEEAMLAAAHAVLAGRIPGLLTILVPRHPERGPAIAAALGLTRRRGAGALPAPEDGLYLADTLGELGLFYRVADLAVIGGSLVPHGGQNPLEPARLGCPILAGPHMHNFAEIVAEFTAAGAIARCAATPAALAEAANDMLTNGLGRAAVVSAARRIAARQAELPDQVAAALLPLLPAGEASEGQVMVEA